MKNIKVRNNGESGQVSIITVIAFILLFSVLTISFSRIMVIASRQAVNDELAASAKAAAESGIEDAKRILSYCASGGTGCEMLRKPIDYSSCTTVSGSSVLMGALQRTASGSSVKVGNANQEEYLCLKMTTLTPDYLGSLNSSGNPEGLSESTIVPLRFADENGTPTPAKTIRLQWHNTNQDGDGEATLLAGSDLPPANKWGRTNPAVVRAEFVAVPIGGFKINDLSGNTRAVTLRPSSSATDAFGATVVSGAYDLDSWIAKDQPNAVNPKVFLVRLKCQNGVSSDGYACSISFTILKIPGGPDNLGYLFDTNNYSYYLRLQAIYGNASFRLSAKDTNGKDLYFDNVQAAVDVTGRTGESLKRLGARLNPNNGIEDYQWWPDYAIDSAGKVCKNMTIKDKDGTDNCLD